MYISLQLPNKWDKFGIRSEFAVLLFQTSHNFSQNIAIRFAL
jgi:hypothetical protein